MTSTALGGTLRHLRDLFHDGTAIGLGDGTLLARYADSRDEAAFEALVARHGPMVLATCRAVLRHEHDVEDAFQATFLVLAKKARSVRAGDTLGGWLHRVAYRVSVEASAESRRRRRREAEATMRTLDVTHAGPDPDIATIVHEELDRLPDRHRLPVVLCDLEGLTYEQAAVPPALDRADAAAPAARGPSPAAGAVDASRHHGRRGRGRPGRVGGRGKGGGPRGAGALGRRGGGRRSSLDDLLPPSPPPSSGACS